MNFIGIFKNMKKYYRWGYFFCRSFFWEKPKGLDFHLHKWVLKSKGNNGYTVTSENHLKQIFSALNITENNSFIDIGCGKGFVLTKAAKQPYKKVTGIDVEEELIQIARKNISILKLQDRINISVQNAMAYNYYDEYDHFYFFNPFSVEILKPTLERILESLIKRSRELTIIYVHPTAAHQVFMETGRFVLVQILQYHFKDYETYIYRSI